MKSFELVHVWPLAEALFGPTFYFQQGDVTSPTLAHDAMWN